MTSTITSLPDTMVAMVLEAQGQPLTCKRIPLPEYGDTEVLVKVKACGVCRTDLHVIDGDLKHPKLPIIPGHEIIGEVVKKGEGVTGLQIGDLVGIPWLAYTCGECRYCKKSKENLCENALFTGYTKDGGFAEYTAAEERYCFLLPDASWDASKAPLLCAGLIGYRSYKFIGENVTRLGIYGFGAAAHILTQIAVQSGKKVFAFTRDGDDKTQLFALQMGAVWAGDSSDMAPEILDAAIIFAPDGSLVPKALENIDKGGVVVCGGIHMSDIPSFRYETLWGERTIRSVANLTRQDAVEYIKLAKSVALIPHVTFFALKEANKAIDAVRAGSLNGAAVIRVSEF